MMMVYILWREFRDSSYYEIAGVFKSEQEALNFVKKHNGILGEELDDYTKYPKEYYAIEEQPVLES